MTTSILLGQKQGLAPILGNYGIAGIGRGEPETDRDFREEDSGEAGGDLGREVKRVGTSIEVSHRFLDEAGVNRGRVHIPSLCKFLLSETLQMVCTKCCYFCI